MFSDVHQPAVHGMAVSSPIHIHHDVALSAKDLRHSFQVIPFNLSPEETRAMVRDLLG